ncbi:MAG: hypothetical protein ACRCX2_29915 [Paraclostridium sp.]
MKDLTNMRFGRWIVIRFHERIGKNYYWWCKCDCGKEKRLNVSTVKNNPNASCGCYNREVITKHNLNGNKIYHVFNSMKSRCYSINNKSYHRYGGRGVTICNEWLNDVTKFVKWSYDNGYNQGLSIDRIDVNGNYEPSNCRWTDKSTQSRNKTTNTLIEYNGETKTICDWADELGILRPTLCYRIYNSKWSIEKAFTTPIRNNKRKCND